MAGKKAAEGNMFSSFTLLLFLSSFFFFFMFMNACHVKLLQEDLVLVTP